MEIAGELDMNPLEALLWLVRKAAGRVAWVDRELADCEAELRALPKDDERRPELAGQVAALLKESRLERRLAAQTSAAAVNGGAVAALTRRAEDEGAAVADAIFEAVAALQLEPAQRMQALEAGMNRLRQDAATA